MIKLVLHKFLCLETISLNSSRFTKIGSLAKYFHLIGIKNISLRDWILKPYSVCVSVCVWAGGRGGEVIFNFTFVVVLCFNLDKNVSLETFLSNLVSLTCPSLRILGKTQTGVFLISELWSIPNKRKLS